MVRWSLVPQRANLSSSWRSLQCSLQYGLQAPRAFMCNTNNMLACTLCGGLFDWYIDISFMAVYVNQMVPSAQVKTQLVVAGS